MRSFTVLLLLLFSAAAHAQVQTTDLVGKSFCAQNEQIAGQYSIGPDGLLEVKIKKADSNAKMIPLGKGEWTLSKTGALQITFGLFGSFLDPAVTDYNVEVQEGKMTLVDAEGGQIFDECTSQ